MSSGTNSSFPGPAALVTAVVVGIIVCVGASSLLNKAKGRLATAPPTGLQQSVPSGETPPSPPSPPAAEKPREREAIELSR
jgi:hypothetical protein